MIRSPIRGIPSPIRPLSVCHRPGNAPGMKTQNKSLLPMPARRQFGQESEFQGGQSWQS
jgi:hypothetical protein